MGRLPDARITNGSRAIVSVSKSVFRGNEASSSFGIREDFPLLWEIAEKFDFAERLGGCNEPLWHEIDAALHELWDARRNLASASFAETEAGI